MEHKGAPQLLLRMAFSIGCALSLVSCVSSSQEGRAFCQRVEGSQTLQIDLLFGRDISGQDSVSDAQWANFLRDEVTPRFPEGLTVLDASGQWRDEQSGQITQERSFLVQIVAIDSAHTLAQLAQIRQTYKERFRQQSVGLTITPICSSF